MNKFVNKSIIIRKTQAYPSTTGKGIYYFVPQFSIGQVEKVVETEGQVIAFVRTQKYPKVLLMIPTQDLILSKEE